MEDTQRTLVVVLTMHRSGSSVATSILNRLGMSLGPFELIGATPSNPHGYFEAYPILELNKDVQKLAYGFTEDVPESEEALDKFVASKGAVHWPEIPADLLSRGRSIIEKLVDSGRISGFKDPRTVLLWPFWKRVLADFPTIRVVPITLLRSPHEIAMSLCSRSLASGGVHAYWDCLDVVAIHYSRLKKILDEWIEPTPVVRFGSPSFLNDLALTTRRCGLDWDVEKASEMLDSSCVHHVAARVPHEAQQVYDSLCGQCDIFDHHANQARLNADSRVCERIVWRRVRSSESAAKSTRELLTQSQADLRRTQDVLHRAHVQLREAHNLVHSAHEQLREAHNQVSDAHYRLREAYEQLRVAHDQARNLSQELREIYEQLHGSQTHNAQLMEGIRQTNQALEQSNLEVQDLRQHLGKFEDHPVLGVALKGRRRLRRALDTLRSAG